MGKTKNAPKKSVQHYETEKELTTRISKDFETRSKNGIQQVFLQQSVTILAFKDKSRTNGTASPDVLEPKLLFGLRNEDIPVFIGAIIGASLIVAFFLMILTLWKCCCRMQLLKKKKYWLHVKSTEINRSKHGLPSVVQSNSVVFLGLKPAQVYDCQKMEKSLEACSLSKLEPVLEKEETASEQELSDVMPCSVMAAPCHAVPHEEDHFVQESSSLPHSSSTLQCSAPIEPTYVNYKQIAEHLNSKKLTEATPSYPSHINIPNVVIHCDESLQCSPAVFHHTYYSGTFDQQSLYSCASYLGSEIDLKTCSLTRSSYNLRPSSTADCYYDIFQRASLCKKRKNRMRGDIAAAIALNRSQSAQLNKEKDTDSLVENEVEVVLDERTTL